MEGRRSERGAAAVATKARPSVREPPRPLQPPQPVASPFALSMECRFVILFHSFPDDRGNFVTGSRLLQLAPHRTPAYGNAWDHSKKKEEKLHKKSSLWILLAALDL